MVYITSTFFCSHNFRPHRIHLNPNTQTQLRIYLRVLKYSDRNTPTSTNIKKVQDEDMNQIYFQTLQHIKGEQMVE